MREEEGSPPGATAISPPASSPTTAATAGQLPPPLPPLSSSSAFCSPLFTLHVNSGEAHCCRPGPNGWARFDPIQIFLKKKIVIFLCIFLLNFA